MSNMSNTREYKSVGTILCCYCDGFILPYVCWIGLVLWQKIRQF